MRISAKGRYALAAVLSMARQHGSGECVTVASISEQLGISKIYLEQVFSLLKRGGLVTSIKGAQGGYQLARTPGQISALDVLAAVELSLFEKTEETVRENAPDIEAALRLSVFDALDTAAAQALQRVSLSDMVHEADKQRQENALMFYI